MESCQRTFFSCFFFKCATAATFLKRAAPMIVSLSWDALDIHKTLLGLAAAPIFHTNCEDLASNFRIR